MSVSPPRAGISHAEWLPVTHRPPHDPRRLPLNQRVGWRLASSDHIEVDACGQLTLAIQPESLRSLSEPSGAFGGLQLAKNIAWRPDFGMLLLDRKQALLKKFDPCDCRFVTVPCTGGHGAGIRQFRDAAAIAVCGDNLLVADRGNHRLVVYSLLGYLVRGIWQPPADAVEHSWQPVDVRVSRDRKVLVADPANGCIHVFNFAGRWLQAISAVGAVSTIAVDRANRLYVVVDEAMPVTIHQLPQGGVLGTAGSVAELLPHFDDLASSVEGISIDEKGRFDLGGLCARYRTGWSSPATPAWFDIDGSVIPAPPLVPKKHHVHGTAYTQPLDSRLYRCQWDRIAMQVTVPKGTRVVISTFSAESELSARQVEALAPDQWLTRQQLFPEEGKFTRAVDWDCLIRSAPGRFLWLKIDMTGDTAATPAICEMLLDFPRISLARYLPAVFTAEPQSADFTDRLLSVFDRGFRQMEHQIDTMAALFDPMSAPAAAGKKDFLSWLASWIGVTLNRQLPLETRRRLVKNAGHLYQCRGTLTGLRHMLDLYLGFSQRGCESTPDCRPCADRAYQKWQAPPLILEHFALRRWLFVGCARLGERAYLWGQKIVNRSQLNGDQVAGNAQLGVTQLNTRQDPLRDPFHVYAHKFSLFLPAWVGRLESYRKSIAQVIDVEKPAHTEAQIVYVEPRFRIGIQSMIGFDSVIGCYPRGVTLDESLLGRASVLSEQDKNSSSMRIGSNTTIGTTARLK